MKVNTAGIPGPLIFEPEVFGDNRGFFFESWNASAFKAAGIELNFVQDNHSLSAKGVLRGLHFQNPNPQGKLVRVVAGSVWDVAVDLRRSSPHFGKWTGIELSAANKLIFWVPPGFAHGFVSLEDETEFLYKCTVPYSPEDEKCLIWNDPLLAISWPTVDLAPRLSSKDAAGLPLTKVKTFL